MRQGLSTSEAGKLGAIAAAETIHANKQKRIDAWNANPKLCKFCSTPISYKNRRNDFCDHSCAAAFNNKGIRRHGEAPGKCLNCGSDTYNEKFCSQECMGNFWWEEAKTDLLSTGIDNSSHNKFAKRYLTELHQGKCQVCGLDSWQGQPMPLVIDHIDGNAYNNNLSNLRVTCNNCDALSPTFKNKNKGSGRFKRAERYKLEKEMFGDIEGFKFKH